MTRHYLASGLYSGHSSITIREGDARLLPPGPGGPPPFGIEALPERHGIAFFELLLVDPQFVFICWEITDELTDPLRQRLGDSLWQQRVLQARFLDTADGALLAERELYGESGRWFVELQAPGRLIQAQLGVSISAEFHLLLQAGPLQLPRVEPLEPLAYEELSVSYGTAEDGSLVLLSAKAGAGVAPMGLALDYGASEQAEPGSDAATSTGWSVRR